MARSPGAITIQQAQDAFTQAQTRAKQILTPIVEKISAAFKAVDITDLSFGLRGSLATGYSFDKVKEEPGQPWNPDAFDVDAFVKSTSLAQIIPGDPTPSGGTFYSLNNIDRAVGFRSGDANYATAQLVKALIAQAGTKLAAAFGTRLKPGAFTFKLFPHPSPGVTGEPL